MVKYFTTKLSLLFNSSLVRNVDLRRNEMQIDSGPGCHILIHTVANITRNDEGRYECITELMNGTLHRTAAGYLHTIGE